MGGLLPSHGVRTAGWVGRHVSAMTQIKIKTMFAALQTHPWVFPVLEILHIIGIALLLGNLVLFELRVWGLGAALPVTDLARLALSLAVLGFSLCAVTGLLMFASQALELLSNRAFIVKMGLLTCAGMNAAWFHARGSLNRLDGTARGLTLVSIVLWLATIACGRFIADL